MPHATAPTSVQVTSEPAWPGVRCRSAEMAESIELSGEMGQEKETEGRENVEPEGVIDLD